MQSEIKSYKVTIKKSGYESKVYEIEHIAFKQIQLMNFFNISTNGLQFSHSLLVVDHSIAQFDSQEL